MKSIIFSILLLASILQFSGCGLLPTPKEELPPITQEGKNTFGCLVNGKVWLPKGSNGTANLDASYDPNFSNGSFDIGAYNITNEIDQFISIGGKNVNKEGRYDFLQIKDSPGALFNDKRKGCFYTEQSNVINGYFTINRLDVQKQIVSGVFEFILYKNSCDTIKVAKGRFDMKF